jgi:VWFA-related protein
MRHRLVSAIALLAVVSAPVVTGQSPQTFRSGVNLILVDVTVRDGRGQPVRNLQASDFEILENGKPQTIVTFAQEDITTPAETMAASGTLTRLVEAKTGVAVRVAPPGAPETRAAAAATDPAAPAIDAAAGPLTSADVAGRRIWVLLFDTSSMQPEDVQKAADAAIAWGQERMTPADLVAVAAIGSTLEILSDFTNDREKVVAVLKQFAVTDGTAAPDVDPSTMAADEAVAVETTDAAAADTSVQELDSFNNDIRLRGIRTICDGLLTLQQRKSILYFSSGMARNGSDNAIESRAAVNACSRANTSINPVDSRGLQAVVAGGSARQGSRGGVAAFSGRGVMQQFSRLAAQQETLQSLAADTGGTAFTDSNDFGEAFDKIAADISSYYILGYASTNTKQDGAFRRIEVKLTRKIDARVRAREGYYADRDFAHTGRADRESLMQEQLLMAIPATDVPLLVAAGYFRLANADACGAQVGFGGRPGGPGGRGRGGAGPGGAAPGGGRGGGRGGFTPSCFYVPISVAVPGDALPASTTNDVLDIRGFVRDERNQPFATIKQTITVPPAARGELASRQVLFQTGATLPPGRYIARIIVRENVTGKMGTFEATVLVPELTRQAVKMSTVVVSTQLIAGRPARRTPSPLVRDDLEIVPNLTRVVSQDQKLYFYYEVYDPALIDERPHLRTSLTFYRGKVKVYETPIVERTAIDAADRRASIFELEIDAGRLTPGLYTCQVNVVDAIAGQFALPRFDLYVRAQ